MVGCGPRPRMSRCHASPSLTLFQACALQTLIRRPVLDASSSRRRSDAAASPAAGAARGCDGGGVPAVCCCR